MTTRYDGHTPPPWAIDLDSPFPLGGDARGVLALTPDRRLVRREVASLLFDTDDHPGPSGWREDAANARLIEDAPLLLAAARRLAADLLTLLRFQGVEFGTPADLAADVAGEPGPPPGGPAGALVAALVDRLAGRAAEGGVP